MLLVVPVNLVTKVVDEKTKIDKFEKKNKV